MIGHAVIGRGTGEDGDEVIAVWNVDTEGTGTGAWVYPASRVLHDPDLARTMLSFCARRSVAAWDTAPAIATLTDLERSAGIEARDWAATAVALPDVLAEVGAIRSAFEKRVAEVRATKPGIVALEWTVDILDPVPADAEVFRRFAHITRQPGAEAIQEVLLTARMMAWCVRRWRETAAALSLRDYLHQTFGPARSLPPAWEARLTAAFAQRTG